MGYTTDFDGSFTLDRPLTAAQAAYLRKFAETRRMKRDPVATATLPDPLREAVGLPIGSEAGYYVGSTAMAGQDWKRLGAVGVVDDNNEPDEQPGLWNHWVPTEDGAGIEHDGGEKFYDYAEWLQYICDHFLKRWDLTLNGKVRFQGEEPDDRGAVIVQDNKVRKVSDTIIAA